MTTIAEGTLDPPFSLALSPDGLEVRLTIKEQKDPGKTVCREDVLCGLAELGVVEGCLDGAAIDRAIGTGAAENVTVARGRQPQHGQDGWLESLIPEARSRIPREDDTGHVDYCDLGDILTVKPGDPLMKCHPPTGGTPGMSLRGDVIPARPGKAVAFAANLSGTAFARDDALLLEAAIAGQPVIVHGGVVVEPVYKVAAVNAASGHIHFDGTVVIAGDVSAGMKVVASGDIHIGGVVELATLEAGGSISIKGGAIGVQVRKTQGEHHIRCGGNFSAGYAQQVNVEAGDSIFIDDMAMQCEFVAINHIRIGHKRRGNIVGGSLRATLSITGKVIGSPNRVRTHLEIGVNPALHKQLLALAKEREAKESQLLEVGKLIAFAKKNPGKLRPEMVEKANATYDAAWQAIEQLRGEQDVLTKKIELSQQAQVVAEQAIHEGVEVQMGQQVYRITGEQGACAVALINGRALGLLPLEEGV